MPAEPTTFAELVDHVQSILNGTLNARVAAGAFVGTHPSTVRIQIIEEAYNRAGVIADDERVAPPFPSKRLDRLDHGDAMVLLGELREWADAHKKRKADIRARA